MNWIYIDTWIVIIGMLCAMSCALLGNFLLLRRMSMMGDAISHAVLPGLAGGFLFVMFLQGSPALAESWPAVSEWLQGVDPRHPLVMLIGAALVGVLTALFTEWVHGFGKVDHGASMGVVFTTLFAVGLLLIEEATDRDRGGAVDLDASCVLYGAIEYAPLEMWSIAGLEAPRAFFILATSLLLNAVFVVMFFKELRISSFDPGLATTLGINARLMHYLLMTLVAVTTVASFETIGSILVIAMLIVPAAAAHLWTERLLSMILVSLVIAAASAALGHVAAITVPSAFGFEDTSTAGMMAFTAGVLFVATWLAAPRHGVLSKAIHRARLSSEILREDLLGLLYRLGEEGETLPADAAVARIRAAFHVRSFAARRALRALSRKSLIEQLRGEISLTEAGRNASRALVRSHRLWEAYLVDQVGLRPDHVHGTAMTLEHITDPVMRERLARRVDKPAQDPHGRAIP
jgi:manganese/zinc/iron transport system permease protein